MKNQSVYMGLFLMALALYGAETAKNTRLITLPSFFKTPADATAPTDPALKPESIKLDHLFRSISQNQLFSTHADGVKLIRNPDNVMVRFYSDDVYSEGNFAVREIWYPLIDELAKIISPELGNGLEVEIRGYADRDSAPERKPSDYGQSEFAFSFSRAEWLARYFEKKWQIELHPHFKLVGMGAQESGKMTELVFHYREQAAPENKSNAN